MRRGDVISTVDGKDTAGMDSGAVAELLRGPKGTQVKVSVKREGATEPYTATVTRGEIETSVVDAFWVKPGIAYLGVTTFEAQNVSHDVETLLRKMGEQNVNGLILDLRDNLGGLVTEAVSLAGRFLRNGQTVVSHHGRAEQEQVFRAKGNAAGAEIPDGGAGERPVGVGLGDRVGRAAGSRPRLDSGRDHLRQGLGAGAVPAVRRRRAAADHRPLLHAQRTADPARLLAPVVLRVLRTSRTRQAQDTQDVKSTDSGRKVFGGGGITPDEKYGTVQTERSSSGAWATRADRTRSTVSPIITSARRNRSCRPTGSPTTQWWTSSRRS